MHSYAPGCITPHKMSFVHVQICFGWGVGISRIIDNKHSTADVVGGFVLGAMFGLVFVLKVCTRSVMMLLSGRCAYLGSSAARVCLTDNI